MAITDPGANREAPGRISTTAPGLLFVFLGALAGIPALAIDMGLPALDAVEHSLGTDAAHAGATLSVFVAVFSFTPLVLGPLSDRFGRRPILLFGLILFTVAGLLAAMAPSIALLLLFRFIQGAGAGAGSTLPMAIVRDIVTGNEARHRLAQIALVRGVAPAIAPAIGTIVLLFGDWRTINLTLALIGLALLAAAALGFRETRRSAAVGLRFAEVTKSYATVFSDRTVMGHAAIQALAFGAMFSYIAGAPLILISVYRYTPAQFSIVFLITSLSLMSGSYIAGELAKRAIPVRRTLLLASAGGVIASLIALLLSLETRIDSQILILLVVAVNFAFGVIGPNAWYRAMQPLPQLAGYVSAVGSCFQMLIGALASAVVSTGFDGRTPISMTGTMLAATGLAFALAFLLDRSGSSEAIKSARVTDK